MPAHSAADTSSAPSFLIFICDRPPSQKSAPTADSAAGFGVAGCGLPQQSGKLFRRDLCSPHHLVDLGGILLLNAPFQNLDAVVQLDAAFLLFFQRSPAAYPSFSLIVMSSNHFESRPNPGEMLLPVGRVNVCVLDRVSGTDHHAVAQIDSGMAHAGGVVGAFEERPDHRALLRLR